MLRKIFHHSETAPSPPNLEERRAVWAEQQHEWEQTTAVPMSDEHIGELATKLARTKFEGDYRRGAAVTAAIDTRIRMNQDAKVITIGSSVKRPNATEVHNTVDADNATELSAESTQAPEVEPQNLGVKLVQLTESDNNGHTALGFEFDRDGYVLDWSSDESLPDNPTVLAEAEDGSKIYIHDNSAYHYHAKENSEKLLVERKEIAQNEPTPPLVIGQPWKADWYHADVRDTPPKIERATVFIAAAFAINEFQDASTEGVPEIEQRIDLFSEPGLIAWLTEEDYLSNEGETKISSDDEPVVIARAERTKNKPRTEYHMIAGNRVRFTIPPLGKGDDAFMRRRSAEASIDYSADDSHLFMTPENLVTLPAQVIKRAGKWASSKLSRKKKRTKM